MYEAPTLQGWETVRCTQPYLCFADKLFPGFEPLALGCNETTLPLLKGILFPILGSMAV